MSNHYEAIQQFKSAMSEYGIASPEIIIPDGALHRFKIDGKLNGAYVLYLDGRAAGYFQDFKQGIKEKWKMDGDFKPFTPAERLAFAKQRQAEETQRNAAQSAKHQAAADKARYLWSQSTPALNHPYLTTKRVKAHGTRVAADGRLIIPLYNANNELVNLQFIDADGLKRFLAGGKKSGCFWWIGQKSEKILIAEGFATAASIHEDTGCLTIVAIDAGNLTPVAEIIRKRNPEAEIIIMADNDISGVGQAKAQAAALAAGCKYLICPIAGMDFNDYMTRTPA